MSDRPNKIVLGVFKHVDLLKNAIEKANRIGLHPFDVYCPTPDHDILHLMSPTPKSPVRFFTFGGGVIGFFSGLALTEMTSTIWNLIVGGKPVTNVLPFLVVCFEATILFGAFGTLIGLLINSRLPLLRSQKLTYRPDFSKDCFGLLIEVSPGFVAEAEKLLDEAGAIEVETIEK